MDDVDLDREYSVENEVITVPTIEIQGEYTKTGNPRVTFISNETKEIINEWFKIREKYIKTATKRSTLHSKEREDDRLFPFENPTAYAIWRNALEKSGFDGKDKSTNRFKIHPHVLRKFFRTRMGAVIPVDVVEALMGHEGYLTEVYRKYSVEDLANFYRQGEHTLSIFTNLGETRELKLEVEKRSGQLQTLVNDLTAENIDLRRRVKAVEEELDRLKQARIIMSKDEFLALVEKARKELAEKAPEKKK